MLNFEGGPLGSAPVESLARVDDVSETTDDFLHGSQLIRPVGHDNINVVQLETFQ